MDRIVAWRAVDGGLGVNREETQLVKTGKVL